VTTTSSRRKPIRSKRIPSPEPGLPPDATFVHHRWIPRVRREWAYECDRIMVEYGSVQGSTVYTKRHNARWHAQSLIRLMVELRIHERWELREHTERQGDSWIWTVEYCGRNGRDAT
jgi:hypothetical protein